MVGGPGKRGEEKKIQEGGKGKETEKKVPKIEGTPADTKSI